MTIVKTGDLTSLCYALGGRLDSKTAPQLEADLKQSLPQVRELIFDCANLEYISSAGLRVLLAAQKHMQQQGRLRIINPSRDLLDIFDMTGFSSILTIEKPVRQVCLDGCERIGAGLCGECWKLDDETVLKLYFEGASDDWIAREKEYAKAAFVLGIPTAISYDIVACGNRRGVVFEMLHAQTLASVIAGDLTHLEQYVAQFAALAKIVHATPGNPAVFPRALDFYKALLPRVDWLSEAEYGALVRCIDTLPDADTCLHGDFHPSNVMVQDKELVFIDMGDFSIGHPYFDISLIYNLFVRDYKNDLGYTITKLDAPNRRRFWKCFLHEYFGADTPEETSEIETMLDRFCCVRQLMYILNFPNTAEENKDYMHQVLATELQLGH